MVVSVHAALGFQVSQVNQRLTNFFIFTDNQDVVTVILLPDMRMLPRSGLSNSRPAGEFRVQPDCANNQSKVSLSGWLSGLAHTRSRNWLSVLLQACALPCESLRSCRNSPSSCCRTSDCVIWRSSSKYRCCATSRTVSSSRFPACKFCSSFRISSSEKPSRWARWMNRKVVQPGVHTGGSRHHCVPQAAAVPVLRNSVKLKSAARLFLPAGQS